MATKYKHMEELKVEASEDKPKIYFDPKLDLYLIEGKSFPEDAKDFYKPVHDWLDRFGQEYKSVDKNFVLNIRLDYYNTASSKQLAILLKNLSNSPIKDKVKVIWHYDDGDTSSLKSGRLYQRLIDVDFEFSVNAE